ncbi:unnamed protein product [marine sediment metagenome]|uniref:Uncharacterized protein n=1 Tax=marine sediment metagenome TaxID=412755 RepID=X1T6U2_9ZZZZ
MKQVTNERYAEILDTHKNNEYHLVLKGWQVPILHGLIALAADHPGIKAMDQPTKQLIAQVRLWCKDKFRSWGFTPQQVEYLDKMREETHEANSK